MNQAISHENVQKFVDEEWEKLLPTFIKILEIPSQSRSFDPEFLTNGLINQTCNSFYQWILAQNILGLKCELVQQKDRSPFIFVEIQGNKNNDKTVLFYGHMDKQPPFQGWAEGLHPYKPVIRDGKLYARGSNDDHYAMFASILAVKGCQVLGYQHPRVVMIFEADEESGSDDIQFYVDQYRQKIGKVDIVFCLDSNCGNYEQLWLTTTLRGVLSAVVSVKVLKEGVHSGDASGIVPSSFRIFRQLLDRIENSETGQVVDDFQVVIPGESYKEAYKSAQILGSSLLQQYPFITPEMQPVTKDYVEGYLNKIWRAQLSIVGGDCLPQADIAGNVLRPETKLKLSIRLPPTKDPKQAEQTLTKLLTENVPYNAQVEISQLHATKGFLADELTENLKSRLNESSKLYYNKEMVNMGVGVSIPLMNLLKDLYPEAQLIVTGVEGPQSNAHGPNEFLHIDYCKKLICCVTHTLGSLVH